jgi:hypothetical protein
MPIKNTEQLSVAGGTKCRTLFPIRMLIKQQKAIEVSTSPSLLRKNGIFSHINNEREKNSLLFSLRKKPVSHFRFFI